MMLRRAGLWWPTASYYKKFKPRPGKRRLSMGGSSRRRPHYIHKGDSK